ncbi:uncharacterized protein Fot_11917 [Forsythia ovata]|uniref:Uncharacterized protein n=1 Tax=Forsythia ovata TaxID=205694 RepID=A0ABD1WL89_9LAMI
MELGAAAAAATSVEDNDKDTAAVEEGAGRLVIALNGQTRSAAHQKRPWSPKRPCILTRKLNARPVNEVLEMYEGLLKMLPDNQMSAIQRAIGLKIEQLKAELAQLNED